MHWMSTKCALFIWVCCLCKQHNLKKIYTDYYSYLVIQIHTTGKRRIDKRIRPWVGEGIRRIKRWIWRWIRFPQTTPRRLTQVEYEWGRSVQLCVFVCMCVWEVMGWGARRPECWRRDPESERKGRQERERERNVNERGSKGEKGTEWKKSGRGGVKEPERKKKQKKMEEVES